MALYAAAQGRTMGTMPCVEDSDDSQWMLHWRPTRTLARLCPLLALC
jgi:hypothetical protein